MSTALRANLDVMGLIAVETRNVVIAFLDVNRY